MHRGNGAELRGLAPGRDPDHPESWARITPTDTTKTYGDALAFAGTEFSAFGLVNGDTISTLTITSAGAPATAQVTDTPYAIEGKDPVGTGLTNYLILFGVGDLTVEKRDLEIAADDAVKTYGETVIFAGTEFTTNGLVNDDAVTAVSLESTGDGESAGVTGSQDEGPRQRNVHPALHGRGDPVTHSLVFKVG